MSRSRIGVIAIVALATLLTTGPGIAGTASIGIDQVGGRKIVDGQVRGALRGPTLVEGHGVPGASMPTPPPPRPLVADAGDSAFVAVGSPVTLLGAGFGGAEPYSFLWTTSAGIVDGANSATAQVNTSGLAPGTYSSTLTITDSAGATASDLVKWVVFATEQRMLLDQTKDALTPGVVGIGAPGTITFPFDVPANTTSIAVKISWQFGVNDFDLRVLDPSGVVAASHGDGVPTTQENASVANPVAGRWTVAADKFATVADTIHAVVTATVGIADPRPVVKGGGPYKFAVGTTQAIAGTVSGGTAPVSVGWDTDQDGVLDKSGASFTGSFPEGRRLITIKATDANGLERRETTSVLVATPDRLAAETTAIAVLAVNDTGVNPYHFEFSADTYPDPDVLRLTNNFTRHPSEYIAGYPKDAQAINMTRGKGYFPPEDAHLWDLKDATHPGLEFGKLYWIPGTKIVGAIQPGTFSCSNCTAGAHVILDDDGHGSGSTSVSTGNRYGYCPTCLLVISKGLSSAMTVTAGFNWVDIQSNSWGTVANLPLDLGFQLVGLDPGKTTRAAVERGQSVLFAAGNGTANAFDTPSPTYGTSTTGPDWNVVVGAIRRDNQRAVVGDGTPAHLSAWGDGNLPSACRTGTVSQCAFGGTSAATPYTSGIFGTVLTEIRRRIGDGGAGQRPGQVIADGFPVPASKYLADGKLTRAELREAVLKTAFPLNQDNAQTIPIFPYPLTAPYNGEINVLFEGYGAATPNSAKRAVDVLLGKIPLPVRTAEDRFFDLDRQIRDSIWGGYDRDGDGAKDSAAVLGQFGIDEAAVASAPATWETMRRVASLGTLEPLAQTTGSNALTYFLHRAYEAEPGTTPSCTNNVTTMDQSDTPGDREPCFENRATSVLAAYRPLGMWPTPDTLTAPIPAGSTVNVELYMTVETPTAVRPNGVLIATDREIGGGASTPQPVTASGPGGTLCASLGPACWTKFSWSFQTTRHALAGEQITFQVQLIGTRSWAFGFEGAHASKVTINVAPMPGNDLDMTVAFAEPSGSRPEDPFSATGIATYPATGTTPAGDHPTIKRVWVAVDDPTFANPTEATLTLASDGRTGGWSAPIPALAPGQHSLYAKACIDRTCGTVAQRTFTTLDTKTSPRVQWQIVPTGATPSATGWAAATGLLSWSFSFNTTAYGVGDFDIYARILEGGVQTAIASVRARFR